MEEDLVVVEESISVLVERAQGGDRAAFDGLVDRHRSWLRSRFKSRLSSRLRGQLDIEDLLQETFMRAFERVDGFTWQGDESFRRWLARIAEHLIWNASQKRPRRELSLEGEALAADGPSPLTCLRRKERLERFEEALARLRPDHRDVVRFARIEGLKTDEIAARMERSPGAVKVLLFRALRELKKTFGETESLQLPAGECRLLPADDEPGE